jgi:hypothetical protein
MIINMNISHKPLFKVEKNLFDLESIKAFFVSRPELEIQGLIKVDRDTARVFYLQEPKNDKSLVSEMIKL